MREAIETKCFRLQELSSLYGLLEIDSFKLVEAYDNDIFDELRETSAPVGKNWPECHGVFHDMTTTNSKVIEEAPDIYIWNSSSLVLSPKAMSVLESIIGLFGEFLPFQYQDELFHLFVVHAFAEEDRSKSEKLYDEFGEIGIKNLAFQAESVGTKPIFKTDFDSCTHLYCTDRFKEICVNKSLRGLVFHQNLGNTAGDRV